MSNPLVAPVKETSAVAGVPLLEDATGLKDAIESKNWAAVAIGAVGTALDVLTAVMDPFGAIFAAGVGWLMEHVGPLKEALNALTGNADEIESQAETWTNVAKELESVSGELTELVKKDLEGWQGEAADAYRKQAEDTSQLIASAQKGSEGAASGVKTAGEVVAAVRSLVRDTIADLVGHLISWALQVVFTMGIGMTWVVPQVVSAVAKTASKITQVTTKLVKALKALMPLLKKAGTLFEEAGKALKGIKGGKPKPGGKPKDIDTPKGSPGKDDATTTAGSHSPPKDGGTHGSGKPDSPPPGERGGDGEGAATNGGGSSSTSKPDTHDRPVPDRRVCRDEVPPKKKNTCGDPVDIATGEVIMEQVDLELGAFRIGRVHLSSYRAGRSFGTTWAATEDQRLEIGRHDVRFVGPDGTILTYPLTAPGAPVQPASGPRWMLHRDADGSFTLDQSDEGRMLWFAGSGVRPGAVLPVQEILFANGETARFTYETGILKGIQHSDGARVAFRHAKGRLIEMRVLGAEQVPDVVVQTYGYDERGHLNAVVNSSGLALRFDYDDAGRLTGWQDRNGVWYRYLYDAHGRCIRTVGAEGFMDGTFDYEPGRTRYTDALGHVTSYELNERGQTVRLTNPLGVVTEFAWDESENLITRVDPLGRCTTYDYASEGTLRHVIRPDGSVVTLTHEQGELTAVAMRIEDRLWRRDYQSGAAPDPVTTQVGAASAALPPAVAEVLPEPAERDQFGRPRSVREAGGRVLLGWTVEGLPSARTGARGEREVWHYDGEGNELEHIDELGRLTRREYGPFDKLIAVTDPAGARTQYGYDRALQLVSVTDPLGQVWSLRYDAAGRLSGQTDFGGRTWTFEYDAAGQLVRVIGPGGVTENRYDLLGNLVEVRAPHGTTTYEYDPVGEVTRVASADSVVEFERDERGRVVRETIDGRSVTFAYDEEQATIRRRTPSGVDSEWSFDDQDRPVALAAGGHTVRFRLDENGRVLSREADAVSVLQQTYSPRGLLAGQTLSTPAGGVLRRAFDYAADGSLAGVRDEQIGTTGYARDAAGRIVSVSGAAGQEQLGYDLAGNLTQWSGATGGTDEYDGLARRTRHHEPGPGGPRTWEYQWTGERLTGLRTPDGGRWRYRYDPLGRRIAKERLRPDGSVAEWVRFTWDGTTLVEQEQADATGARRTTTWELRPGTGEPVAQLERDALGIRFFTFVTDGVGTPTELVNEAGRVAWRGARTLWGRVRPVPSPSGTPLRFPGQYADLESGLHYNVFRYYDPATARYLSQDPLGMDAGSNPTAYVADPFAEFDAIGLLTECERKELEAKNKAAATDPQSRHNAANSGGSSDTPSGNSNKRKAEDPPDDTTQPNSKKTKNDPWERVPWTNETNQHLLDQKADPNGPLNGWKIPERASKPGERWDGRHIISFQTMRDNLQKWVNHHYPPGHPERDKMYNEKYPEVLKQLNSKKENLPIGEGTTNSSLGAIVKNFPVVEKRVDGTYTPSGKPHPDPPMNPEKALDKSGGYSKPLKGEFAKPIYDAFPNSKGFSGEYRHFETPEQQRPLLNDIRDSADFDWPGGKSQQFEDWSSSFREFNQIGQHPERFGPEDLDGVIDRFMNLKAPDGSHDSFDQFNHRPGATTKPLAKK
ncbi:RHS repeat-associated protein [Amycolatopsis sulphurea]|uniref:RHS repeat-associated protein n=1 Tax=Amycolatopsis sulphurea TaxID=76022 RepID=A0A2A9FBG3_9PSEU|nr:RHS repeat-associated core domain-containing protein [Amycolatopsis sulphurea]PFG47892.1 RHS repeat-associated protein [Amycolatopsis sulphurea]